MYYRILPILTLLLLKSLSGYSGPGCKADFYVASAFNSCPPFPVQFYNTSTGSKLTYHWDFGDGNTSVANNTAHVYYYPGKYDIRLIVTDSINACSDTLLQEKLILVGGPSGQFNVSTDSGCAPLTVSYSGSISPNVSVIADLGDGPPFYDTLNLTYTYTRPGKYYPVYTLTDSLGCMVAYAIDTVVVQSNGCATGIVANTLDANAITIYPVPAENFISISGQVADAYATTFSICNMLGEVVIPEQRLTANYVQLDIHCLATGVYLCLITAKGQPVSTRRFIKL